MSLQVRLASLITAIGADIKSLSDRVSVLENPIDAGGVTVSPAGTVDGGTP